MWLASTRSCSRPGSTPGSNKLDGVTMRLSPATRLPTAWHLHHAIASYGHALRDRPTVEPFQRIVELLRPAVAPQRIAHQPLDPLGVIDAPHFARREHNPRGARDARLLVEPEGGIEVVLAMADRLGQRHRVFDRHACCLLYTSPSPR